jgi:rubrerythrin
MKYIKTFEQFVNESIDEAKKPSAKEAKEAAEKERINKLFDELEEAEDDLEYYTEDNLGFAAKFRKLESTDDKDITTVSHEILSKAGAESAKMYDRAKDLEEKAKKEEDKKEAKRIMAEAKMFDLYGDAYDKMRKYNIHGIIGAVKALTAHIKANKADLVDTDNNV